MQLCSEMADYFCSGMGGYVVRWPAIFALVWAAMYSEMADYSSSGMGG